MAEQRARTRLALDDGSLVDLLDRLLDTGVALDGSVLITLAGVDLIRLDLRLLLASVESLKDPHDVPDRPHHRQQGLRRPDGRPFRIDTPHPSYAPHSEVYRRRPAPCPDPLPAAAPTSRRGAARMTGATVAPAGSSGRSLSRSSTRSPATSPRSSMSSTPASHADITALARRGAPTERDDPASGVAGLVVAVVDVVRQLLERQALRRMDAGGLTDDQVERLGRTLIALERQVHELADRLGLRGQTGPLPPGRST